MRLFRAMALVAGAFLLVVHAAVAQGLSPVAVVDSYERARAQHDVDGALAQLADNAVITLNDPRSRSLTSREQIRDFLRLQLQLQRQLQPQLQNAEPQLTTSPQVQGNTISWSERADDRELGAPDLTVQAVVEDGKIQSLVYRPGRLVYTSAGVAADSAPGPAGAILGAIVLLGLGLLSLAGARQHGSSGSNLRGRLMGDLRLWCARSH